MTAATVAAVVEGQNERVDCVPVALLFKFKTVPQFVNGITRGLDSMYTLGH